MQFGTFAPMTSDWVAACLDALETEAEADDAVLLFPQLAHRCRNARQFHAAPKNISGRPRPATYERTCICP